MRTIVLVAILAVLTTSASAQDLETQDSPILYRTFKATVTVDSAAGLPARLDALAAKTSGAVTRLAVDRSTGTTTANLSISSTKLEAFSKALQSLGRVDSEELETSDYSNATRAEQQKLKMYSALASAPVDALVRSLDLSQAEKDALTAELRGDFSQRVRNAESSLETYRGYLKRTFVFLTFKIPDTPVRRSVVLPGAEGAPEAVASPSFLPLLAGGAAVLVILFLLQRRLARSRH